MRSGKCNMKKGRGRKGRMDGRRETIEKKEEGCRIRKGIIRRKNRD